MKFRDDIDPAKTWVISDTHFGHQNIIGFCHRPADFESLILENIAREVPDDPSVTLLHLGDLCYRGNSMFKNVTAKHLPQNIRKLLVRGNHDRQRDSFYKQSGFRLAQPFAIRWGLTVVSFSHYPWNINEDGVLDKRTLRIHGHIHNNGYTRTAYVPFLRQHVNVSVEQTKYNPVNLSLLLSAVLDGSITELGDPMDLADTVDPKQSHVKEDS
jgi:calcineurin-like phosphoesterase family protein